MELAEFEDLTTAVFDSLNIKTLNISYIASELMTDRFFNKIKNCYSLRSVVFTMIDNAHAQLDAVETNLNVKKWTIKFKDDTISECVKERLTKMLLDRNDNSLFIDNKRKAFADIPQKTQMFKISPVSYC